MPNEIDRTSSAQRRSSKLLTAMAIFICLSIAAYMVLTLLVNRQTLKIQIVVSYDEFNIYIRQLGLDIRRIGLVQACTPQIHLNGLGILLLFHIFGGFCSAAGQQGDRHHQCHKRGKQAVQCSFVHQIVLLTTLEQLPFCTPEYHKKASIQHDRDIGIFYHRHDGFSIKFHMLIHKSSVSDFFAPVDAAFLNSIYTNIYSM